MTDRRPRNPAQRLDQAVLAQGIGNRYWPDANLAQFAGHDNFIWWIARLRQAETRLVTPSQARTACNSLTWVFTRRGGRICALVSPGK